LIDSLYIILKCGF